METVSTIETIAAFFTRLWPVWAALIVVMGASFANRRQLGLYGRLYDTTVGMIGVFVVFFWVFSAIFADIVTTNDPLSMSAQMRYVLPGSVHPETGDIYILGGDKFGRDIFSRMINGSQIVLIIAPAATLLAFIVGMFLGLPAGFFGGRLDNFLSFLANLILAFPVILLFYLLVTPGIREETIFNLGLFEFGISIPKGAALTFSLISIMFFTVLIYSKFYLRPGVLFPALGIIAVVGAWLTSGLVFAADPLGIVSLEPNQLNIFVAVVFASSPGVFRIVRGLTLDIATRDYVAAARTRGEGPWYTMLWEVLPNARGPLIVDACLRIGYTTILLGTLGYFGLGLEPESPDWGTTIKEGSEQLRRYIHPAIPPALALMSFVLGLNLLADALREQSLKD